MERFSWSRQPVADWNLSRAVFWTCTKDWPRLNSIAKRLHRLPNDRRLVADQSPTKISLRPIGEQSPPTSRRLIADWFNVTCFQAWQTTSTCNPCQDSGDKSPTSHRLVADYSPTSHRLVADRFLPDCKHVAVSTATSRRLIADPLQTCRRLVGDYNLDPNMGIKWLHKSHRLPVSCKEISRKQVVNRLRSRCKQGLTQLVKGQIFVRPIGVGQWIRDTLH